LEARYRVLGKLRPVATECFQLYMWHKLIILDTDDYWKCKTWKTVFQNRINFDIHYLFLVNVFKINSIKQINIISKVISINI